MPVDLNGKDYSPGQIAKSVWDIDSNRIRVDAEITATIGELQVDLDASEDNVAISDGNNVLAINPDGSINVNVDNPATIDYNEITSIPANLLSTLITKNIFSSTQLGEIQISGTNIAEYSIFINSQIKFKFRTNVTNLNYTSNFKNFQLNPGDILEIKVIHVNSNPGNFNVSIFYL